MGSWPLDSTPAPQPEAGPAPPTPGLAVGAAPALGQALGWQRCGQARGAVECKAEAGPWGADTPRTVPPGRAPPVLGKALALSRPHFPGGPMG